LCYNLGTGLHAGIDVRRLFETEAARGSAKHRATMTEIRERIAQGDTVSDAFKGANGYFPPMLCEMIEVGERTGRLDQLFQRMNEYYEHLLKLRRQFLAGITMPMLQLIGAILVIGLFIWIIGMVSDNPPIAPFGLHGTRGAMIYFSVVGLILGIIGGVVFAGVRGWINFDLVTRLLMNIPFFGRGLQNVALSRLTWSLALATDSDLPADRAAELAVRTTQNSFYTQHIDGMKNMISRGRSMYEAFETTGAYPDEFLDALQTGEIAGRISETMQLSAREYAERTRMFFAALTVAASGAVWIGVAAFIIYMIFVFAMQYIGMISSAADGNFDFLD
jgi:type II secretory pathway component PulF